MTTPFLFGPGSVTQAQVVAYSLVAVVFFVIISLNVAVCYIHRRVRTEDQRQAIKAQKKKMSDVWVYHVHRPNTKPVTTPAESADEQILRRLKASHENLRASLAESAHAQQGTLGQEESEVLEEFDVTNDLFLHDDSRNSSRRSSISDRATLPAGGASDHDSISLASVKMSDFENNPNDFMGLRKSKKKGKRGRKSRGSADAGEQNHQGLPVAEFHNEAFDFVESSTVVERVNDVEL